jgi:decaprenylphospho-beta-D-ribofuranose 2-oxidase
MRSTTAMLSGFGRTAPTACSVFRPRSSEEIATHLANPPRRGVLARGLGRSYGDAAQNAGGDVIVTTGLACDVALDAERGIVSAGAGVSLDRLIRVLVPRGLFLPVSPGTRMVTVGGAIASDIHGKNHHRAGSFGRALRELTLIIPGGEVRKVSPTQDGELFWATVGGMGLTGVIVRASFECVRVDSAWMEVVERRAADLDETLGMMLELDSRSEYVVAWLDVAARGRRLGRSVLTCGEHADPRALAPAARRRPLALGGPARLTCPTLPGGAVNRASVRLFNELWYRRAGPRRAARVERLESFFHPLDGVRDWNRVYGPRGFVQYQFVVPPSAGEAVRTAVELISRAGTASFLTVLKRFGPASGGLLSFPIAGWTLAVDLPASLDRLGELTAALDGCVLEAGGRIYLAKDGIARARDVERMYPELTRFRTVRDRVDPERVMRSDLARRVGL